MAEQNLIVVRSGSHVPTQYALSGWVRGCQRGRGFILLVGLCAAGVLLDGLGDRDVVGSHEARVVVCAREMARSGWPWSASPVKAANPWNATATAPEDLPLLVNPWLIPVMNGELRLQKPPLPYWTVATLFRLVGARPLAARIVPALLGIVTVLLIYALAKALSGRATARYAAMVWVSTYFVAAEYRRAMADPYLAFFSLLCLWCWVAACAHPPAQADRSRRVVALLLSLYLSLGLGLLAKGPVILLHVVISVGLYQTFYRRKLPGSWRVHLVGLAVMLAVVLPWPIYVWGRVPGAIEIWRFESVGELADNVRHARPPFYYLPNLLLIALPWTPAFIAALFLAGAYRRRQVLFPLAWLVCVVVFFSCVNLKKNAYLLPVAPAMTLLVARVLFRAHACARVRATARQAWLLMCSQQSVGIVCGLLVAGALVLQRSGSPDGRTGKVLPFAAGMLALCAGIWPTLFRYRLPAGWVLQQSTSYVMLIAIYVAFVETPKENRQSFQPFAARLSDIAAARHDAVWTRNLPLDLVFYLALPDYKPHANGMLFAVNTKRDLIASIVQTQPPGTLREVRLDGGAAPAGWRVFELRFTGTH